MGEFRIGDAQPAVDVSHLIDDEDILSDETLPLPLPPQPIEADAVLNCKDCDAIFLSSKALQNHRESIVF